MLLLYIPNCELCPCSTAGKAYWTGPHKDKKFLSCVIDGEEIVLKEIAEGELTIPHIDTCRMMQSLTHEVRA